MKIHMKTILLTALVCLTIFGVSACTRDNEEDVRCATPWFWNNNPNNP